MKKIIIPFMLAFTSSMANAEYLIKIPFVQAQGGPLPNNSIVFVGSTEVVPETPVKHEPVDCLTNPTDNPQLCEKSLTAWEQFATDRDLPQTWSDLSWGNKGLSYLPNEPYPITSVSSIYLQDNQLINVNSLSNITTANKINLSGNQLTNVDGLSNLTRVGDIYLYQNQLKNVDGLSKLTIVGTLHLKNNQLTNVDGLANVKVLSLIVVDGTYSGPKLTADTRFCTENTNFVFDSYNAQKSQLCK